MARAPALPEGRENRWPSRGRGAAHLECNWLQCMENSMDPVHFEWLHANLINYVAKRAAEEPMPLTLISPEALS